MWDEHVEKYERELKSGRITKQQYADFHFTKKSLELANEHPFIEACGLLKGIYDSLSKRPRSIPCDPRLLSKKYMLRLQDFAMNELFGKPAVRQSSMRPILADARKGNFEELDQILGFMDSEGKEIQLPPENQRDKMFNEMDNVLLEQGTDFIAICESIGKYYCRLFEKKIKTEESNIKKEIKKEQFKKQMEELKLKSEQWKIKQKKLRKKAREDQLQQLRDLIKSAEEPSKTADDTIKSNEASKGKKAKDFEHYRKTKRPARL